MSDCGRRSSQKKTCLQYKDAVEIIGPAESPLAKIKGRYRFQMLLKSAKANVLHQFTAELLSKMGKSTVKVVVDVDPGKFYVIPWIYKNIAVSHEIHYSAPNETIKVNIR